MRSKNSTTLIDWSSCVKSEADVNEEIARSDIPGEPLSAEEFYQAEFLTESMDEFQEDPTDMGCLFEGDMDFSIDDHQRRKGIFRNAIADSRKKWPDATIPYLISSFFSQHDRKVIAKAMGRYHKKTCIRFIGRTSEKAYIHIITGDKCSSKVGSTGRMQTVKLGPGCVRTGKASFT